MKNFFLSIVRIMYDYYNTGSNIGVGYLRSLVTLMIMLYMNFITVFKVVGFDLDLIDPVVRDEGPLIEYLGGFIIGLPILFTLYLLLPKKMVLNICLTKWSQKYGMKLIFLHLVLSVITLIYVAKNY